MKAKYSQCSANSPLEMTARDWWIVLRRTFREIGDDNVAIIAAGVAFFCLLAVFPLLTAVLSIYGFFADPQHVQSTLSSVSSMLPGDAWLILNKQITAIVSAPESNLGLGIAIGLLIALWSAGSGIRAIMRAMNVAYGERETRNIATFYALAGSMTLSMIVFVWVALVVIIGVPSLLALLKLDGLTKVFMRVIPWVLLISMFGLASGILYRFGPSRRPAKKRWVFPGIVFTTLSWLAMSYAFSKFVAAYGSYNAIYGSLASVVILLIWFWLTAFVVIVGAEINAELERHTSVDTTRGPPRPLGARGAAMADWEGDHF